MAQPIRFHFDPLCPWCWQTSRWVRRLEELGEVRVDWAVFSLAIGNRGEEGRAETMRGAASALRTAVRVREEQGPAAMGRFYAAIGSAVHDDGAPVDDPAVLTAALRRAGLDEGLLERAIADPATWTTVQAEHDELVATHHGFGVPTIVLDGGAGPAIFGPVISEVPEDDEECRELWWHVSWLVRHEAFAELKRHRTSDPDLTSVRRRRERSASAA